MDREEFDRKYTGRLNRQQSEAVHAVEGAVLLLAVPGSGKTTVLVTRLGYMLCCCGIPVNKILTMTYTKAATQETKKLLTLVKQSISMDLSLAYQTDMILNLKM